MPPSGLLWLAILLTIFAAFLWLISPFLERFYIAVLGRDRADRTGFVRRGGRRGPAPMMGAVFLLTAAFIALWVAILRAVIGG